MPYWQLYYHIIWATKDRLPILDEQTEPIVHGFLRSKAIGLGATVFALNGISDHVHLVVSIPPKIAVARFVGQIKGVAATRFNKLNLAGKSLFWQNEYGVFSFDGKRLHNYIAYVERQKEHHAEGSILLPLERLGGEPPAQIHEEGIQYLLESDAWRNEFTS